MQQYDSDTQAQPIEDGRWRVHISAAWNIGDNPNGGYLVSLVTAAMRAQMADQRHPDPVSITTHFLRPGVANEDAEVEVNVVRTGRLFTTLRGTLRCQGKERVEVLCTFADVEVGAGVEQVIEVASPELPAPEDCILRSGDAQGIHLPIMSRLEVMLHPDQAQLPPRAMR